MVLLEMSFKTRLMYLTHSTYRNDICKFCCNNFCNTDMEVMLEPHDLIWFENIQRRPQERPVLLLAG